MKLPNSRIPRVCRARVARLLIAVALAPTLGWAQQSLEGQALEQQGLNRAQAGWTSTVGLGPAEDPKYPGANTDQVRVEPLVSIDYGDRFFIGPLGIGVAAVRWNGFRAGPVLGFDRGRDESDDPHLAGLGDISSSITGGVFARYSTGPVEVSVTARQAISHSTNGLTGLLQADLHHNLMGWRIDIAAGPDLEFGNGDFERTWFGVSSAQAATSGLPVYATRAGITSIGLHAGLTQRASRHILVRFFASLSDITGDAAPSPIVERRTQFTVGAGIAYHF